MLIFPRASQPLKGGDFDLDKAGQRSIIIPSKLRSRLCKKLEKAENLRSPRLSNIFSQLWGWLVPNFTPARKAPKKANPANEPKAEAKAEDNKTAIAEQHISMPAVVVVLKREVWHKTALGKTKYLSLSAEKVERREEDSSKEEDSREEDKELALGAA